MYVINIYSKYAWAIPLKDDEKGFTFINAFQRILEESNFIPNKIWINKDNEFYYRSMKSFLQNNYIGMYSTRNERKSVIAERFIRTLKIIIYKYMTSVSENVHIDKLNDIVKLAQLK